MILNLVKDGHPLLMQAMEDFDFRNPPCDPIELANNLIETMKHYKGLGLSANQCGLPYRAFALWSADPLVIFNPRVVDQTGEFVALEEGCLTYPNLYLKIKRPRAVKVRYEDAFGDTHTERYIGMTARGFLHEMDHLDGVIYTKRASPLHLSRAMNQKKQLDRKIKRGEIYYEPTNLPPVKLDGTI
jgi:peptide deformylase